MPYGDQYVSIYSLEGLFPCSWHALPDARVRQQILSCRERDSRTVDRRAKLPTSILPTRIHHSPVPHTTFPVCNPPPSYLHDHDPDLLPFNKAPPSTIFLTTHKVLIPIAKRVVL